MTIKKNLSYPILSTSDEKTDIEYKDISLYVTDKKGVYGVHKALIHQLASCRYRKANTKTRSEVRGGGKKPWKQKGSGRARAGSSRSPLWKGGGVIFGPQAKIINHKINQKEKQLALRNILYNKFQNTYIVEDSFNCSEIAKTKTVLNKIHNLNIGINKNNQILIIVTNKNKNFYLSTRNIKNIEIINANQINIIALLKAKTLIITSSAINTINKIYNGNK